MLMRHTSSYPTITARPTNGRRILMWAASVWLTLSGCEPRNGAASGPVLADKTVTVAPGGGGAVISFAAAAGQKIRVTMTSPSSSVEPYGYVDMPGDTGQYVPSNETAKPGSNVGELVAGQAGQYQLTVFDGANHGGEVSVVVQVK